MARLAASCIVVTAVACSSSSNNNNNTDGGGSSGSSDSSTEDSGGASGSSSGTGTQEAGGGLTCSGSSDCMTGQICCVTAVDMSTLMPTTACQAAPPCPSVFGMNIQLCKSAADCASGSCMASPLGMGMLCGPGGTPKADGGSEGGTDAAPTDAAPTDAAPTDAAPTDAPAG